MNRIPVFFVLAFFAISAGAVFAQAPAAPPASEYFPFVIPWSDSRTSVTDMSSLNKPIEPVVARDGHFYGAKTGMRIRFIGVSILGTECFPTQADARAVAAHMAKYGINLVRLHALDNDWDAQSSLLNLKPGTSGRFSKTQLDKLDYLVAQLEKHGAGNQRSLGGFIDLKTPFCPFEVSGIAVGVGQLKSASFRRVGFDNAIRHLSALGVGIASTFRSKCRKLESHTRYGVWVVTHTSHTAIPCGNI